MPKPRTPFGGITPPYETLLKGSGDVPVGLYHLHLATAEQLCRLHYSPGSITLVKARLLTLVEHHYVQFNALPTKLTRSPYSYALDQAGRRFLRQAGLDTSETNPESREVNNHSLLVEHTLALNDILIAAVLLKRVAPTYALESFVHECTLKHRPSKVTWEANGRRESFTLIPDALLDFRSSLPGNNRQRIPILLEHDRSIEEQHWFRKRIRAYITLLQTEAYKAMFGVKTMTIAFTTFAGSERLERMREWTLQELQSTNEPKAVGHIFCFASLSQPIDSYHLWLEPCWYTPYMEDKQVAILAGA